MLLLWYLWNFNERHKAHHRLSWHASWTCAHFTPCSWSLGSIAVWSDMVKPNGIPRQEVRGSNPHCVFGFFNCVFEKLILSKLCSCIHEKNLYRITLKIILYFHILLQLLRDEVPQTSCRVLPCPWIRQGDFRPRPLAPFPFRQFLIHPLWNPLHCKILGTPMVTGKGREGRRGGMLGAGRREGLVVLKLF